jgi:hypothetical protein
LKEVALAGSPGSKAMKQVAQQILHTTLKAAGEGSGKLIINSLLLLLYLFIYRSLGL